jgi:hypothetical protein
MDSVKKIEQSNKPDMKSNRKAIEKKMQRLNDLYVNGFIELDKYRADRDELEKQIIDTPKEEKKDLTALRAFLKSNYKTKYKTMTDDEKRTMWRSIVSGFRFDGKELVGIDWI